MSVIIRKFVVLSAFVAMIGSCGSFVLADEMAPRTILAPSGKLRVGLYPGTPTSILPNAESGPRGVGYDLGRAMAERLGVAYEPVVFSKNTEVLEAVKTGKVDAAFTNASASRAKEMDFGPAYLESDLGYLVPSGSPAKALADIDVPGRRVGVTEGSSSDAALSHDLKQAEVVRIAAIGLVPELMAAGRLDAFATNKATLFEIAEKLPGSTDLPGRWGVERHAIAIPKGREQGMAFVKKFTEDAKSGGLVSAAITRAGLRAAAPAP
ncbi:MAG: transporter substrate-binding domain-containing protein [Tardiphaga sp.]|nr:transporter substrate-binding domain-containing protein [Tardiphaga sp.]